MLPIIGGLAGAAGAYADWKAGETGRDAQKWSLGQRQNLSEMFQGQTKQDVLSPEFIRQLMARFQQSTQPTMDKLGAQAAQFGTGPGSGEITRMFGNTMLPLIAGQRANLDMFNVNATQDRNMGIRQLLARLS